eukprot:6357414-Prymnesium_polylepis.1
MAAAGGRQTVSAAFRRTCPSRLRRPGPCAAVHRMTRQLRAALALSSPTTHLCARVRRRDRYCCTVGLRGADDGFEGD